MVRLGLMDDKRMLQMASYIQRVKATKGKLGEYAEGTKREEERGDLKKGAEEEEEKGEGTQGREEESKNGRDCVTSMAAVPLKQEAFQQIDTTMEWVEDSSCPNGWLTRQGGRHKKCFKDTKSGKVFNTRIEAVRSLIRRDRMKEAEQMKEGLEDDGWKTNEYDKKFIPNILSEAKAKQDPPKKVKVKGNSKWKTSPGLPPDWKWKTYKTDPDRERRMLLSPEQKRYLSIYSALRQMQQVEGKKEEVAILSRLLTKDGWFSTELLPTGYWLKQKRSERSFLSLTPAFEQLRTMRELFDHLRCEGHSEEMVAKVQNNYR